MARSNTPSANERPTIERIEALPAGAYVHSDRTPFEEIIYRLSRERGSWFRLSRTYTSHHSPMQTLRKTAAEFMDEHTSQQLEFASEPATEGRVTVYVRLKPAPEEPQPDLSGRFDEPDSIFDEVETVEAS